MIYVKVNGNLYPASIDGKVSDREWDGRESKAITLEGKFADIDKRFRDGTLWSIVHEESESVINENGETATETKQTEFDNSEFGVRGDLIVHTDGTCTVKMGKQTDLESAYEMLYGGM